MNTRETKKYIKQSAWLALPSLFLLIAGYVFTGGKSSHWALLVYYPPDAAFNKIVYAHYSWVHDTSKPSLYYATWFAGKSTPYAMVSGADAQGRTYKMRDVDNWAIQNVWNGQLTPAQVSLLKQILGTLPPGANGPPHGRMLFLSFNVNGHRETRIYDRAALPPEIEELYKIAGAEIEKTS